MGCQSLVCKLKAKLPDAVLGFLIGQIIFLPLFINIKLFDSLPLLLAPVFTMPFKLFHINANK